MGMIGISYLINITQQPTSEDGHCGGLPCSIVTQESSDLPLVHVEGEVTDSFDLMFLYPIGKQLREKRLRGQTIDSYR